MDLNEAYQILEVSPNISDEELKKKYKKLVLQYHPDRNKETDTTKKFIAITDAYKKIVEFKKKYVNKPSSNFNYNPFGNAGNFTASTTAQQNTWTFTFN